MLTARLFHRPETGQAIADHLAVRIQAAFGEPRNGMVAEAGDPPQLQTHWLALGRGLDRGHERRLARGATATLATGALAAQVGVVDLHPPAEPLVGIALHHHLRQLVLDFPRRELLPVVSRERPSLCVSIR